MVSGVVLEGDNSFLGTAVVQMERRQEASPTFKTERGIQSYGTVTCGITTMRHAWKTLHHALSIGPSACDGPGVHNVSGRPGNKILNQHPVDLLVVDRGNATPPDPRRRLSEDQWMVWVRKAQLHKRPKVVLESWPAAAAGWLVNPAIKARSKAWEELGYASRFHFMDSQACGGAIAQSRLMVARVVDSIAPHWEWPTLSPPTVARPMGNLLTPYGLLPRKVKSNMRNPSPALPPGGVPHSDRDPMPDVYGAHIDTPHGVRRLQVEEHVRGLGGSKGDLERVECISAKDLACTTSVFIWERLADVLTGQARSVTVGRSTTNQPTKDGPCPSGPKRSGTGTRPILTTDPKSAPEFSWEPPDLEPGSEWYERRILNLRTAAATYGTRAPLLIKEGVAALRTHRENYDKTGPKVRRLQLLWWEFPREHWDAIREGSRMGFLSAPEAVIHPNSEMDDHQLEVAEEFVDELLAIGAIGEAPGGYEPLTNTPLFCIAKPSSPGEYRVIADCKAGGQNAHMGSDPVYLNRPLHILEQMYAGGWTAVADASKFFYQFPVHPEDQPFLGITHPRTGKLYVWKGCPMGSGSSPALAGRYCLAFVRLLRERCEWFRGRATANCWWSELRDEGYDPAKGYGFSLRRADGRPAVRIWVFVDDFAIHGPDYESTAAALKAFLDLAVDVGLLVHPKKLAPPAQVQRYVGFIFDTQGSPTLRIPDDKRERGLAMATYLSGVPPERPFSRLALSVIAGTLESIADATPNRIGHTHLRATHALIHPPDHDPGRAVYYTTCTISDPVRREMLWWVRLLQSRQGRGLHCFRSGVLIPTWGDGSGTGTGGTISLPGAPMELWMGQWSPKVHHFSSNWKELSTLLLTLERLAGDPDRRVKGCTVFYFTDNTTTYYVVAGGSSRSPGLHQLVERIQWLTLELQCQIEVVHVPGVVMIDQGTDGLSRGVWVSSLHPVINQRELTRAIFAPLRPNLQLARDTATQLGIMLPLALHDWRHPWGRDLFGHVSVWFPPPELARQCIIGILESWVEVPQTTGALIFVPRTLARCWLGLSRYIQLVDTIPPQDPRLGEPHRLPIPVLVLYIAPHIPTLPVHRRMGPSSLPAGFRWHDWEAARMRELQGAYTAL